MSAMNWLIWLWFSQGVKPSDAIISVQRQLGLY